ncbi:MAG: Asp-tRNA(Asn)/Glu-tRNA(Gln) amidotransferase subunit GatC [Alphaproteobacteria bacterium]|nr:Asp-tRNA(Asn)/Glu-tRNA(Gln) amidotransferase subunit GatC [Alphaproteobacteria bacterium]MBN2780282.1 Asp-tRNA(Asn)/Glu-tRNA(Gln) amidotransferase subunit GatC [Alphaproteobacteria bacterium]
MDLKKLENLAYLARLEMNQEQLEKTAPNINAILDWVAKLQELETDNVEPLYSTAVHALPRRADHPDATSYRKEILSNAPETDNHQAFFTVPTVVE